METDTRTQHVPQRESIREDTELLLSNDGLNTLYWKHDAGERFRKGEDYMSMSELIIPWKN